MIRRHGIGRSIRWACLLGLIVGTRLAAQGQPPAKGDAKALATNPSATIAARMFAVRHLLILTHPYLRYGFAGLVAAGDSSVDANGTVITTIGCAASLSSEAGDQVGIPLPADYADRIRATLDALIAASDTPDSVKRAARCGN